MKKTLLLLGLIFSISSFANTKVSPFETILVKPLIDVNNQSNAFNGEICFHKPIVQMNVKECATLEGIEQSHTIRFFYPDMETEVSSSVTLSNNPVTNTGINFTYTPTNVADKANLIIVAEPQSETLYVQLQLESSLKKQIANEESPSQGLLDNLATVQNSLKSNYPAMVYVWPALNQEKGAEPFKYVTHTGDYRVGFELDRADVFPGEKVKLKYSIHSLVSPHISTDGYLLTHETQEIFNDYVKGVDRELEGVINSVSSAQMRTATVRVGSMGGLFSWKRVPINFYYPNFKDIEAPYISNEKIAFKPNQNIIFSLKDDWGRIKYSTVNATLTNVQTQEVIPHSVNSANGEIYKLASGDRGAYEYIFSSTLPVIVEGEFQLTASGQDFSGNHFNETQTLYVDGTAPSILPAIGNDEVTTEEEFYLDFSVFDLVDVMISVWVNGVEIYSGPGSSFSVPLFLDEGANLVTITATDAAGNTSNIDRTIFKDTTPPSIDSLAPSHEQIIYTQNFLAKGVASEPLLNAEINGKSATINGKNFEVAITAYTEGQQTLTIKLTDLKGNTAEYTSTYIIAMPLLHIELVNLSEGSEGKVLVTGLPGSVRENATIEISGGFFNNKTIYPNEDGSWSGELDFTNTVNVKAIDNNFDYEEAYSLAYNVDTTLAGIIKDPSDAPIPGVTVTIVSSGQSAVTNASGVFNIADPVLGDQDIKIDGTTVPQEFTEGLKEYSYTNLKVSIGNRQKNIIERVIYISPKITDGSEVEVVQGVATTVESENAPGVILDIPANKTLFPNGQQVGTINIAEIPAEKTSVDMPEGVAPATVYALEPSGLKFQERIPLTLPNDNDFPVGMELVILSKNSSTGLWEVDGSAKVEESGEIKTKEGQGISHFSEVFAAPFGMEMTAQGSFDKPGIDNQMGNLTTTIDLPSYTRLGNAITPKLIYKSNWANPYVTVSNIFNLPRKNVKFPPYSVGGNFLGVVQQDVTISFEQWLTPESIDTQYFVAGESSGKITFEADKAPENAVVTYGVDLSNIESGLYLSLADYEIKYRNFILRTTKTKTREFFNTRTKVKTSVEQDIIESIFPPELRSYVFHQNKKNSEFGAGWKLAVNQKVINPGNNRLMIENEDGGVSSYVLNNTVETITSDNEEVTSMSLYDNKIFYSTNAGKIHRLEETGSNKTVYKDTQNYQGKIAVNSVSVIDSGRYCCKRENITNRCLKRCPDYTNLCERSLYTYNIPKNIGSVVPLQNGIAFLDKYGAVWNSETFENVLAGTVENTPRIDLAHSSLKVECQKVLSNDCDESTKELLSSNSFYTKDNVGSLSVCGTNYPVSTGFFPKGGFSEGSLTTSKFNKPLGMSPGVEPDVLLIADTGNNLVRKLNLLSNTVSTITGIEKTTDSGDGGSALLASVYHPRAVIQDSIGNYYITSERGYLRKIDISTGIITTISGKPLAKGGTLEDGPMDIFNLNSPTGMVLDEENGYLYVADTGNHRIVQLDLVESTARTVLGLGMCDVSRPVIEGSPALDTMICSPTDIALDSNKNLVYLDKNNKKIRKVNFATSSSGIQRFASVHKDNTFLTRNADGTFTREYRDGTVVSFDQTGRHTSTIDLTGRVTAFHYDQEGRLTSFIDPTGGVTSLSYSGDLLGSITDPAGRVTQFLYSGNQLVEVNYPDSTGKSFYYDTNDLMVQEVDQRGNSTSYNFNSLRKLASITSPDNSTVTLQDSTSKTYYNSYDGSTRKLVNYAGESAPVVSDTVTDANGGQTDMGKNEKGEVNKIIDPEGKETKIDRDEEGRPIKITKFDGSYVSFIYDQETGDLLRKYDSATSTEEKYQYNTRGQILSKTRVTEVMGEDSETSTPLTYEFVKEYDAVTGLLKKETDGRGVTVERTYGPLGTIASIITSGSFVQSFEYDANFNLKKVTSPMGESTNLVRDNAGNILQKTDAKNKTTHYTYDAFNRLLSVTTPSSETTSYAYLETGELAQITNPLGHKTSFAYNSMGRMIKKTSPRGQITELLYDANGNIVQEIDPKGQTKTFTYDIANRLIKKVLPDNEVNYTYTTAGKVETVSDDHSSFSYSYVNINGKEEVATVSESIGDLPSHTISYGYDIDGKVRFASTGYNRFDYFYNASDKLNKVTNSRGKSFTYGYDAANRMTSMSLASVMATEFSYDANSFITKIENKVSGVATSKFSYTRDAVNNRTSITTLFGVHNYTYDDEGQITSATHPEADSLHQLESFAYDELGNRTSDNQGNYVYDNKKFRLEEDWRYVYVYDTNGNLTSRQDKGLQGKVQNFIYSSENQLTAIEFYDNNVLQKRVEYLYDALGRRAEKKIIADNQETIRRFAYLNNEIIAELDGENEVLVKYTHSGLRTDDVLEMEVTTAGAQAGIAPAQGAYYFAKDGLGSIVDIHNSAGAVVQHYAYSSFGKILKITNSGVDNTADPLIKNRFTYTNREFDDESGLYYYRARYYDAHSGRFMQEDPHPGIQDIPSTYNSKYNYVLGNPVNGTDPSGEILPILLAGFFIGGLSNALFSKSGSFAANFLAGALTGTVTAVVGVGAGFIGTAVFGTSMLGSIAGGMLSGSLVSAASQYLLTGSISWGLVGVGALTGGIGGLVGYGLGKMTNDWLSPKEIARGVDAANKNVINGAFESQSGEPNGLMPGFSKWLLH